MMEERDFSEDEIFDRISNWRVPFESGSEAIAKERLMARAKADLDTSSSYGVFYKIAAGIALLMVLGTLVFQLGGMTISNQTAETSIHTLPCGTMVEMEPGSELSYNKFLWSFYRSTEFEGKAYFNVVPGNSFEVETEVGDVEVLGTKFTVWSDSDDLLVHCDEGKVKVESGDSEIGLSQGEYTVYLNNALTPQKKHAHTGFLKARKTALNYESVGIALVINELEQALAKEIECDLDPALLYSGNLDPSDPELCLHLFCKAFGAKFEIDNQDVVRIRK